MVTHRLGSNSLSNSMQVLIRDDVCVIRLKQIATIGEQRRNKFFICIEYMVWVSPLDAFHMELIYNDQDKDYVLFYSSPRRFCSTSLHVSNCEEDARHEAIIPILWATRESCEIKTPCIVWTFLYLHMCVAQIYIRLHIHANMIWILWRYVCEVRRSSCMGVTYVYTVISWWRHPMEPFSASLAICAGNSPVPGEFPAQRPVKRSFDVFFDLCLSKCLSKQSWGWWFETTSRPSWRQCNDLF